ncbi:DUF5681 domain-containing protein [Aurantimonas sp. C2-6-R+9]|uniref:DUF5681 domain-containing protein n=1 Tax=unclassified Aurantimonas TaxID=2638230 RepID=UPI002E17CE8E|nr:MULTISPECIES: DUF5681 domain-containing protein [unclassified Aurantimonas]MEC5293047.1 DUF5681 domain-containing protein [Aurantimonas sp. C2-3-R2]MEC5383165.1 DUF5681 domain-containing protein [Aurantimonas sp. C2-6-R+9]MEC5414044.1 DUF5681 domain-containing protein [Aurantimonas sp. C2-4-R8]
MAPAPVRRQRPKLKGPDTTRYDVGYGKPPVEKRFGPGQSGNPRGRPRGAKNKMPALNEERLKSIILEEAYRAIRINDGDRQIKVPMAQAIIRAVAVNAVKGQQRAQRLFTELLATTERENRALHNEWLDVAMTYKIEWDRELERRRRLGIIDLPEPLPHPDHIIIDLHAGTVRITGPSTKEEKALWDLIKGRRHEFEDELRELEAMIADPDHPHRNFALQDIKQTRKVLAIIDAVEQRYRSYVSSPDSNQRTGGTAWECPGLC